MADRPLSDAEISDFIATLGLESKIPPQLWKRVDRLLDLDMPTAARKAAEIYAHGWAEFEERKKARAAARR